MTAITVRYSKLVTTDLANQAINFAESGAMGHRVQVPMSVDDMNTFFVWDRTAGSSRAVGHFNAAGVSGRSFGSVLTSALSSVYLDIDSVTNGLSFSSAILDANTDSRIRLNGAVSANDLVMAYVLYKCYGTSSAPTKEVIYNLEDAQEMLTNSTLLTSITNSFNTEEALSNAPGVNKGAVDAMFRDLLASDPMRFFDANGNQVGGIFETNADVSSTGSWGFVENDKVELRVQFRFTSAVTRRGVQDPAQALTSAANMEDTETNVIAAGSTFTIRLQLIATDTQAGAAAKAAAASSAIADALAAEVAATARAQANAQAASRAADLATQAAAAQSAAAQARYNQAVKVNAAQATAASNAQAAAQAAEAACEQAIASGSTEENIQAQRAAAVAAQAAATNAKAIADAAAADLQNALNAMNVAIANLNQNQTNAATATASLAQANAAASAAALAKSNSDAAAIADQKAAGDAATDPFTQTLTLAQQKILDPQTVSDALALVNSITNTRLSVQTRDDTASAALAAAQIAATNATQALSQAISSGATASDIQILRSAAVTAAADQAAAQATATAANNNLVASLQSEQSALDAWKQAIINADSLSYTLAAADVNAKTRAYNDASGAYWRANGLYVIAKTATTVAQASLSAAVASGLTATETQVKQQAVINCQQAEAMAKKANDDASVTMTNANTALVTSTTARGAALAKGTLDASGNLTGTDTSVYTNRITDFNSLLAAYTDQQNTFKAAATKNAVVANLVSLQIAFLNAAVAQQQAANNVKIATDAVNVAVTSGKTVPEVLALRTALQQAQTANDKAVSNANDSKNAINTAIDQYNTTLGYGFTVMFTTPQNMTYPNSVTFTDPTDSSGATFDASGSAILTAAAAYLLTQITNATTNSLVGTFFSAKNAAVAAREAANQADASLLVAKAALEQAILSGATLDQIDSLRHAALAAAAVDDVANNTADDAEAAYTAALGRVNADGNALAVLNATLATQKTATTAAQTSQLNLLLMKAWQNDLNAMTNYTVAALAQQTAEAAVTDANNGGSGISSISTLVMASMDAANRTSKALAAYAHMSTALSSALSWVGTSADASGVMSLSTTVSTLSSFTFLSQANDLVNAYMRLYVIWTNSKSATLAAQSKYNVDAAALNTAITQGAGTAAIATLQATVAADATALANATSAQNLANIAQFAALGKVNASTPAKLMLDQAGQLQSTIINGAKSNMLVVAYLAAVATENAANVAYDSAHNVSMLAQSTMNYAIISGNSIAEIQNARTAAQAAAATEATTYAAFIAAQKASNDAKGTLTVDAGALAILQSTLNAQEAAIAGATSNARAKAYFAAKEAAVEAASDATSKQAAYDVATTALDQAITAGASIDSIKALRDAAQVAGVAASSALLISNQANAAATEAKKVAIVDPNAAAILQLQMQYDANRIALAKANDLLALYLAANANAAKLNNSYTLAQEASTIAQNALDAAIISGAGIDVIQTLRNNAVQTATNAANAKAAANAASAAALQSQTNASYDTVAAAILSAQNQFSLRASALSLVNEDKIAALNAYTNLSTIQEQANYQSTILSTAQGAVTAGISSGMIGQEIVNLQATAQEAAMNYASTLAEISSFVAYSTTTASTLKVDLATYSSIAYPIRDLAALDTIEMDLVGFGQQMISDDYMTLYFKPYSTTTLTITAANKDEILRLPMVGTGIPNVSTLISSVDITASLPLTNSIYSSISMYPSSIKVRFTSPVTTGDTRFFVVGGRSAFAA